MENKTSVTSEYKGTYKVKNENGEKNYQGVDKKSFIYRYG